MNVISSNGMWRDFVLRAGGRLERRLAALRLKARHRARPFNPKASIFAARAVYGYAPGAARMHDPRDWLHGRSS